MLNGKKIVLGVTGSIAAYKAALLVRLLVKEGAEVQVVMTPAAKEFITPLTLSTLSGRPVLCDFFSSESGAWNSHVELGLWADAMVIAPATASTLGKMAGGVADNLLVTTYLSMKAPVFIAPAMDLDMFAHPSTQHNIEVLKGYGNCIIEPAAGELASHLNGKGRMEEPQNIVQCLKDFFLGCGELAGKRVLVTAGPMYEKIDPVRFIGNYSTGKMGFAVAKECAARGAEVVLVAGPVSLECNCKGVTRVDTPNDLKKAIEFALLSSISKRFIIEDFLEKDGFSVGSESFVVNGKLLYNGFYDQYFDNEAVNPYTPSAEVWPSVMSSVHQEEVRSELQRLFTLLGVTTGLFNVECRVCTNGKVYLMEVSPRAGGNRLAEMLNFAADVNIIEAETRKALGLPIFEIHEPNYRGHFAILVLHSDVAGQFDKLVIDEQFRCNHVIEEEVRVVIGDYIDSFKGANAALGTLFLRFDTREALDKALNNQKDWLKIEVTQ